MYIGGVGYDYGRVPVRITGAVLRPAELSRQAAAGGAPHALAWPGLRGALPRRFGCFHERGVLCGVTVILETPI